MKETFLCFAYFQHCNMWVINDTDIFNTRVYNKSDFIFFAFLILYIYIYFFEFFLIALLYQPKVNVGIIHTGHVPVFSMEYVRNSYFISVAISRLFWHWLHRGLQDRLENGH